MRALTAGGGLDVLWVAEPQPGRGASPEGGVLAGIEQVRTVPGMPGSPLARRRSRRCSEKQHARCRPERCLG